MKALALHISDADVLGALAAYLGAQFSEERLGMMMENVMRGMVGTLTLEQAREKLHCKTRRELKAMLRALGVKLVKVTAKRQFVLAAELETALRERRVAVPAPVLSLLERVI